MCLFPERGGLPPARPPPPASANPRNGQIDARLVVEGYTVDSFGAAERTAFEAGVAGVSGTTPGSVSVTSVTAAEGAGGDSSVRKLLSGGSPRADGVNVAFRIASADVMRSDKMIKARDDEADEASAPVVFCPQAASPF